VNLIIFPLLTIVSGAADSYGFNQAVKIWVDGQVVGSALARSSAGYAIGIAFYWLALRFVVNTHNASATLLTLVWFGATIVGVGVISGDTSSWDSVTWTLSVIVVLAIGGMLYKIS
jgi:hypothetical protein